MNFNFGLIELKINQLLKVKKIDSILISTDDDEILSKFKNFHKKIVVVRRDKKLCNLNTKTQDLINHVANLAPKDKILWTQVSSPLVNAKIYEQAIALYKKKINLGYDSLMSVTKKQIFIWNDKKPLNYKIKKNNKWPRTQDIQKTYFINSSIFIFDKKIFLKYKDRIGKKPYFFNIDEKFSIDIDNHYNFKLAEILYKSKL